MYICDGFYFMSNAFHTVLHAMSCDALLVRAGHACECNLYEFMYEYGMSAFVLSRHTPVEFTVDLET